MSEVSVEAYREATDISNHAIALADIKVEGVTTRHVLACLVQMIGLQVAATNRLADAVERVM